MLPRKTFIAGSTCIVFIKSMLHSRICYLKGQGSSPPYLLPASSTAQQRHELLELALSGAVSGRGLEGQVPRPTVCWEFDHVFPNTQALGGAALQRKPIASAFNAKS